MCGIVGKASLCGCKENQIVEPLKVLRHRGPNNQSYFCTTNVLLGHARLSIIDVVNGNQPMHFLFQNKNFIIVYNGEVYNFKILKEELVSMGLEFETDSDTEVVLKWLVYKGVEKGVQFLNGMFAIALYNETDQEIYLIRDRMGIKPLYFSTYNSSLFFSSELESITKFDEIEAKINVNAMEQFIYFGYPIAPNTMYKDIFELKAGHLLKYNLFNNEICFEEYWSLDNYNLRDYKGTYQDATTELEIILKESISDQVISDVGYSTFLSGGIDSSLVTSIVSTMHKEKFNAYTVAFSDEEYNELPYAREVAERYKNINHIIYNTDNFNLDTNFVDLILKHVGQPFADSSCIPTYLITEEVSKNEKVILSGDGGDEFFMGYETFNWLDKINSSKLVPLLIRQFVLLIFKKLPIELVIGEDFNRQINKALHYSEMNQYDLIFSLNSILDITDLQSLTNTKSFEWLQELKNKIRNSISNPYLALQEFIIKVQLSGDMLRKVDSMSMANSIEVRVPLLDNRVIDFALSLPTDFLYRNGVKKSILRDVAKKYLPENVINHKKWGFAIPMHDVMEKRFIEKYHYLFEKYGLLDNQTIKNFYQYKNASDHKIYKKYSQYTIDHVNWMMILLYRWIEKNKVKI